MSNTLRNASSELTPEERLEILESARTIAVVGLSDNQWKPSYGVAEYMQDAGYEIIPVNPNRLGKLILGQRVYATLADIPKPVDIVNVFRPAQVTPKIAEQAVAIGAKVLWLQLGIANDEAARIALEGGLTVVMNRCISTDHGRLFNS
jgi:predicted CoA-binding protein